MGLGSFLRRASGMSYVEEKQPVIQENKAAKSPSKKDPKALDLNKPSTSISAGEDKVLKDLESELQKTVERLQDIQEKIRVRRGV
jgi:hypothetical protein